MTFSLLLDLDDTLLNTNLDAFLPAYFKKLSAHMAPFVQPDIFIQALLRATQKMYTNNRADLTMEQAFAEHFYPALGRTASDLAPELERFYDEVFPTLQPLTTPRPDAIELVEWAFTQGWKVAIATDPLFPRKAILHRLRWAGLDPEKYPFTFVSDYQNFHYAKASVAFFPEFLARMGWADEPLLMVGDSMERDVVPASRAGVPVYWLDPQGESAVDGVARGSLVDLKKYLQTTDVSSLQVDHSSASARAAFLQASPAIMHTTVQQRPASHLAERPQADAWSFLEILCHLRDVDFEVNLPRIETILKEENPFIAAQTTDQWALERDYNRQQIEPAIAGFVDARDQIVNKLNGITAEEWSRPARHSILGPTNLKELAGIMVDHDILHIRQGLAAI